MLANLALILTLAMLLSRFFERCKLPGLLGMILTGILLGRSATSWSQTLLAPELFTWLTNHIFIHPKLMNFSSELRSMALIIILFRAGLGIKEHTLKKIGWPALKMSIIPSIFEASVIILIAPTLFKISWLEAGMLAFIIAAVSPAVVVPSMLELKQKRIGEDKDVPTLILAAASIDDVFAITMFGAFVAMAMGQNDSSIVVEMGEIPVAITLAIVLGACMGYLLIQLFKKYTQADTHKVTWLLIVALTFTQIERSSILPFASLLAIMTIGFMIRKLQNDLANTLASKFNNLWLLAEIFLFVLIGAEVDLTVLQHAGIQGIILLTIGLTARSFGVWLALSGSNLLSKEKLFCVLAYLPKATVQAAIGGLALGLVHEGKLQLSSGEATGQLLLTLAILSIVMTAPLGAIAIRLAGPKCLASPSAGQN